MIIDLKSHPLAKPYIPLETVQIARMQGVRVREGANRYVDPHLLIKDEVATPIPAFEFERDYRPTVGSPGIYYDLRARKNEDAVHYVAELKNLIPLVLSVEPLVTFVDQTDFERISVGRLGAHGELSVSFMGGPNKSGPMDITKVSVDSSYLLQIQCGKSVFRQHLTDDPFAVGEADLVNGKLRLTIGLRRQNEAMYVVQHGSIKQLRSYLTGLVPLHP